MGSHEPTRSAFDLEGYRRRARQGPCFVCAFQAGDEAYRHHRVYEDDDTVAFLARYPTLLGYTIVAPRPHLEDWDTDLSEAAFARFQRVTHRVARAIAATVPTERMYSLSLGSRQGNAHLHWHLAPLPPGVAYERQQYHALMAEHGVLPVDDAEQPDLAARIAAHLEREQRTRR